MHALRASLLFLVAALGSGGCQFFFPTPIEHHDAPRSMPAAMVHASGESFRLGEVMKGEVFLDAIHAGTGELRVTARCDDHGKAAFLVDLTAASAGLARMIKSADTKSQVYLEADSGMPISAHTASDIGDEATDALALYGPAKTLFKRKRTVDEGHGESTNVALGIHRLPIDTIPHNADSFLGYLRNWRPAPGTSGYLFAVFGSHPWRADMTFVGPETISTARGEEKAVRIDGMAQKLVGSSPGDLHPSELTPKRPFSLWISDDDRRAPLRALIDAEIAKVTVELTTYEVTPPKDGDAMAACKPLFDGEALEREATVADEERRAAHHDGEDDERDGIQKILKTSD